MNASNARSYNVCVGDREVKECGALESRVWLDVSGDHSTLVEAQHVLSSSFGQCTSHIRSVSALAGYMEAI